MLSARISTLSMQNTMQLPIRAAQVALQNAQTELATGRHADVNLELARHTGRNLRWREEVAQLETSIKRNEFRSERAETTQITLEAIKTETDKFRQTILGARSALNGNELIATAGKNALNGLLSTISTTFAGEFIFSGRSSDLPPLSNYEGQAPQAAFDNAFLAEFGFAKNSPLASTITKAQMDSFIDGALNDLFTDPLWSTTWSTADSENQLARISSSARIDADANVNEAAFRQVLKAAVIARELGDTAITTGTRQAAIDKAMNEASSGLEGLGQMQARVGHAQQTITLASQRMSSRMKLVETAITRTEGVSQYDVATRINALMVQLESSYAVTSRISKLSLLSHI